MEGGMGDEGRDRQTDRVRVLPVSVPGAGTGLAEGRSQGGSAPLASPRPTSLQGPGRAGRSPRGRRVPGAATHPWPCSQAPARPVWAGGWGRESRSGEPLRACRRSQEKQAARHPGRPSAVKCCISHKGGSQRALLREIRGTGKAEPSFNTRLIFMELRQRQPPCRERSRSAEGERRRLPGKQLLAGRRVHLAHKTRRTRAAGGVPGPAGARLRPAERP